MNRNDPKYSRFHLVSEMYDSVDYLLNFNPAIVTGLLDKPAEILPVMLTGEGSSRIFPAKNAIHRRLALGSGPIVLTESSTDLAGKKLDDFTVIGASNSGRTKELVTLLRELKNAGHRHLYGLSCNRESLLEKYTERTLFVDAGIEKAVAATKSVIAQALIYEALLIHRYNDHSADTRQLSALFEQSLNYQIDSTIIDALCNAEMIYFAGNNNGVAEELTLKTNEIIRKKAAYLPGTYLLHGVEEVITPDDLIIMVDAYPDEYDKIRSIYSSARVVVFSDEPTPFHTLPVPGSTEAQQAYIKLAAGWNLLVEAGIKLGIDIDKPEKARKIGNEAAS
jgi:glutamine---fructose-6-phosphate transaminase (isomerizing)